MGRDLFGIRFGKLVAIKNIGSTGNGSIWECQCDCGGKKNVARGNLISGSSNSCGCIKVGNRALPPNEACSNAVWNMFVQRCKKRKMKFDISKTNLLQLVIKPCFYCGLKSSNYIKQKYGEFYYNGLDRIDNTKGYIENNILTCCKHCNALRMDILSVQETFIVIDLIRKLRGLTGSPWKNFKRLKREDNV